MEYDVQYDVLPDLFGGTTGVMTEGNQTLVPGFQHFDAFGVRLTDLASGVAEYRWRGQEGSETAEYDAETHPAGSGRYGVSLVYMQTRDYDPETGRFLAPDALYVSSLTTQGMNRYIYCNNDPVNWSDPSGLLHFGDGLALLIGGALIAAGIATMMAGVGMFFAGASMLTAGMATILEVWADNTADCNLKSDLLRLASYLQGISALFGLIHAGLVYGQGAAMLTKGLPEIWQRISALAPLFGWPLGRLASSARKWDEF